MNSNELIKTKMKTESLNKSLTESGSKIKQNLDKDDFLKLLITQLQHQDPNNPMEDKEFIAQMAQFSSMEQMLNVNKSLDKLVGKFDFQSSFDLLGKKVDVVNGTGDTESQVASGVVDSVSKKGDDVFISVGGKSYLAQDVRNISY
ncbi:MAG: hypothetical protein A2015_14165 [Spirochaetes bacterium GWF1_31_7]|nr:MAG: hypothetical protein A2Y30_03585 [Spirochaetes bacterium GWE1_32_154]OHD45271.1 MAG: hypothetical protein A2Y29_02360 [Spirochaetes bacterium GWE2_31_10]OHD50626.1 MAG: hypothetical protein A2015_14165 [Spirochaetes bacterium GWF1_31_7]HBD94197.1 flagellar hook assembly protein FlgD [Spirochaetia bacterium]HBI36576.1 flagellar hook assembly protein FlgD [Spirochaetia bacterium]